jgi:hypothetical protein
VRRRGKTQRLLFHDFVWKRQSAEQLGADRNKSGRWVRKQLDAVIPQPPVLTPCATTAVVDTTFWGREYGVCVFRSPALKENLWWEEIEQETVHVYADGRRTLEAREWVITGVVIDGRHGLIRAFSGIPVQICHFHQIKMVTRRITRHPKLPAAQELLSIVCTLPRTTEAELGKRLEQWHLRWGPLLAERTPRSCCSEKKWPYTHRRLRTAYRSLKTNLPYLFTYQTHPELNLPNTTNSLDGMFSQLKNRLAVHRGLRRDRRYKLICEILGGRKK